MIRLRDYQDKIIEASRAAMRRGVRRYMIVLPTGGGKTVLSAFIIAEAVSRGMMAYFLCHRVELVDQTEATFRAVGIDYGVIASGHEYVPGKQVYIGSIDTVRRRLGHIPTPDIVIIDEASHTPAKSWKLVVDTWSDAWRIGITATPSRLSGEGFNDLFDDIVIGSSTRELIDKGWLAPFRYYAPPGVDPSGLHIRAGDYVTAEAEELVGKITGDVIAHYRRLADGKRAIVFCVSVKHSMAVADAFNAAGISAKHVDGKTPSDERRLAMEQFRQNSSQVLTNVNIFSEGVDVPGMEVVILLRPTRSLALYLQQVGRALRPEEGKTALILDHVASVQMHGFPDQEREWSLYGLLRRGNIAIDDDAPLIRICDNCFSAYSPAQKCPYCGVESKLSPREIRQREGELAEVVRLEEERSRLVARKAQGMAHTIEELTEIGRSRGYRYPVQWAKKVYNGRRAAN